MTNESQTTRKLLMPEDVYIFLMKGIREGFPPSAISRELKILRAALAIGLAHELGLGHGPLHTLIEDSNYEGDLSRDRETVAEDFANDRCSEEKRQAALACIDALEPLSDDERFGAEWLYLRALRWETWNTDEEPE